MKFTVVVYLLLFFTCNSQNKDWQSIVNLSSQKLSVSKTLSYEADYKIKYFDDSDTIRFPKLNFFLLKKPSDSILNFLVKIKLVDFKQDKIYDGKSFYTVLHQDKFIEAYSVEDFGKSFVKNNIYRQAIPNFLTSEKGFENYIKNNNNVVINEIVEENKIVWKIEFDFPTNEEITLLKRIIYIDKKTNFPYRFEGYTKFMGLQDEFFSLNIKKLNLDSEIDEDFFKLDSVKEYTKKSMSKELINSDIASFHPIANFIDFEGLKSNLEKDKIDSTYYKDKLVLVDFWHLGCAPCLKAMPKLNELYKKYSRYNFVVIGINPLDSPLEKGKIINQFLLKLNPVYTNLFVSKEIMKSYQVESFPTHLLFKNGKLIYSKVGYLEKEFDELENMVKSNL